MRSQEHTDMINKVRYLRRNMTLPEIILWSRIRSRKIEGFKFRRQQRIFNYIVDFYCHELKLIIEVDGEIHYLKENAELDKKRDNILRLNGFHIIRLSNHEIITDLSATINTIKSFIRQLSSPSQGDHRGSNDEQEPK